jgi:C-terminal processing protease CtpA/Prc
VLAPDLVYTGKVVVLVNQNCLSECEFFTYALRHSGRAAVVGQYATGGAGGSVNALRLPAGITFTYTQSRAVDMRGVPIIEARGWLRWCAYP